jgi:enamine deaminase RidA (YjgF/YER057c/UK114 family)
MKNLLLISFLSVCLHKSFAQTSYINPYPIKPPGYTHVVVSTGEKTIYLSGQVAFNEKGEVVGKGNIEAQTRQVFENIKICLKAAGADFKDVVKFTYFVKDFKSEYLGIIRNVRNSYINTEQPPASSLVGVQALFNPEVMIEIEAIAVINKK